MWGRGSLGKRNNCRGASAISVIVSHADQSELSLSWPGSQFFSYIECNNRIIYNDKTLTKFADYIKLFSIVKSKADCEEDLHKRGEWVTVRPMKFIGDKCVVIHIEKENFSFKYRLMGV